MGFSLYDIDSAIVDVIESGFSFDEETGEVFFTADDLERLEGMRADKLDGIAVYLKNINAEVAALKAEEKALAERRKQKEAKAERLKSYVASSMIAAGERKFETLHGAYSLRKSSAVVIEDENAIPAPFKKYDFVCKTDKTAIKKAIAAGEQVPGAHIEQRENIALK